MKLLKKLRFIIKEEALTEQMFYKHYYKSIMLFLF